MDNWLSWFVFPFLAGTFTVTSATIPLNVSVLSVNECGFLGEEFFHHSQYIRRHKRFIIGGDGINVTAVPWTVRIDANGQHICTGTLISDRHVLTAGHCFKDDVGDSCEYIDNEYTVCHLIGNNYRQCPKKQKYLVKKIHLLDEFIENKCPSEQDFVVLELTRKIKGARPACLPTPSNGIPDEYEFTEDAYIMGYSRNFDFKGDLSWDNKKLKFANIGVPGLCEGDNFLCTEYRNEGAICEGDSGGPMIEVREENAVLIGVNVQAQGNCVVDKIDKQDGAQQFAINVHKHVNDIIAVMEANQGIDIEGSGNEEGSWDDDYAE